MKVDLRDQYKSSELLIIFCDGACLGNPGPGGWGALICWPDQTVSELGGSESKTTNNRMELLAVIRALELLKTRKIAPIVTVKIFSDSSYVLNGIQKWIYGWKQRDWKTAEGNPVANPDLWQELDQLTFDLKKRCSVSWNWVKGHTEIFGNERCDQIATTYADGQSVDLYEGSWAEYPEPRILFWEDASVSTAGEAPTKPYAKPVYLSLVDGVLERHSQWSDCEKRVKGKSGVKYRKALSAEDEKKILKEWGISDSG